MRQRIKETRSYGARSEKIKEEEVITNEPEPKQFK